MCVCVHVTYGVRCIQGRPWADMRGEFLSRCVMFVHPHWDGGFPNNENNEGEVEGERVRPEPHIDICILMDKVLARGVRDLER